MDNELSYTTPEGHTVFTSKFLKNRGTCCKSACLHCPFGFTLKKLGLQFKDATEADAGIVESIMAESKTASIEWKTFLPDNVKFVEIKGQICGVFLKNHIQIKHLYLRPHFLNQDLSKEMIESYYY